MNLDPNEFEAAKPGVGLNINEFEPAVKPEASWGEVGKSFGKTFPLNIAAGAVGDMTLMTGLAKKPIGVKQLMPAAGILDAVGLLDLVDEPLHRAETWLGEKIKGENEKLNLAPGSAKTYATSAGQSIAQNLIGIGAAKAFRWGKWGALGIMGAMTAGQSETEVTTAGREGGELNSVAQGIIEVLTELGPTAKLMKPGLPFFKRIFTSMVLDLPGEQAASFTQGPLQKINIPDEKSWAEYWETAPQIFKDTLIVTLIQGAVMGGPVHWMDIAAEKRDAKIKEKYDKYVQDVKDQVVKAFGVTPEQAETALKKAEENIKNKVGTPGVPESEPLGGFVGDIAQDEKAILKIRNAGILSQKLGIDHETAIEYQDEIIGAIRDVVNEHGSFYSGDPETALTLNSESMQGIGFSREEGIVSEILVKALGLDPTNILVTTGGNVSPEGLMQGEDYWGTPEEQQKRLNKMLKRKPGVGVPPNERTVLTDKKGGKLVVGKITFEDWVERVNENFQSPEKLQEAKEWYDQVHKILDPIYGDKSDSIVVAFLLSQKRASPKSGFGNVLRAIDIVNGRPQEKVPGLNAENLLKVLMGHKPEKGIGPKLADFFASAKGMVTRPWYGHAPEARQPAAIDVWAFRDIGFIDKKMMKWLKRNFDEAQIKDLKSVTQYGSSETSYEYGVNFYNDLSDHLNQIGYAGGNWTPAKVQAVGWASIQKRMNRKPQIIQDIINGNTRKISIGLGPGGGSALEKYWGKEIPVEVATKEIKYLAELAGLKILKTDFTAGAFLTYPEGSIQVQALSSPETVKSFMDMVGFAFQQSEVYGSRPNPDGANSSLVILSEDFSKAENCFKYFEKFQEICLKHPRINEKTGEEEKDPDTGKTIMDPLVWGFCQCEEDGKKGIQFMNIFGKWSKEELEQIRKDIVQTFKLTKGKFGKIIGQNIELTKSINYWSDNPDGKRYLDSLANSGRVREAELLADRYLPQRVDFTEDWELGKPTPRVTAQEQQIPKVLYQEENLTPQNAKGAVEFGDAGKALIRALKSPDFSTAVHEIAHIGRRFLLDRTVPPDQRLGITDDLIQVAEEFSGAKDGIWDRKAEEKFARGFERYLWEGKSPSKTLTQVFAKIKEWMANIYKSIQGSPIDLNIPPEMMKVYDALLVRGEGLRAFQAMKADIQVTSLTGEDLVNDKVTVDQLEEMIMQDKLEEAAEVIEEGVEEQGIVHISDMVRNMLARLPIKVPKEERQAFREKLVPFEELVNEILQEKVLNVEEIEKGEYKKSIQEGKEVPKEVFAKYPDLAEVPILEKGKPVKVGIPGERGLRVIGITPEQIVMNEKALLKLRLGSEARGAKFGERLGAKVARAKAVLAFKQREANIEDVKKSVNEYLKATLKGEKRGLFNDALIKVTTKEQAAKLFVRIDRVAAREELNAAISDLKKLADKFSTSALVAVDYRNKIKEIISQYELTGHGEKMISTLKATQEFIDRQRAAGEEVSMPQRVLNKLQILGRIPKDELTLNQVQGLINEIELLGTLGKTKWAKKVHFYEKMKQIRKDALIAAATPINSFLPKKVPLGEEKSAWADAYIKIKNYLQKTRIGVTHSIDSLADITGMHLMKSDLDLNFGNYLCFNDETFGGWADLTKNFTKGNFERIGAYAAYQQEGGMQRLENSGFEEDEIKAIELTPEEMKAYQYVRTAVEKIFPQVKKYMMDVYNEDVGEVKNYVSFMADYEAMSDLFIYERFGRTPEELGARRTKKVEMGYVRERAKESPFALELDIDKIFKRHMDDVAYMLTMGRDVKMYSEIINSKEMTEKLGDTGKLAWLEWLDMMARKGGSIGAKRSAALDNIRRRVGAGILAYRLSSILVQVTSLTDSAATIGADWTYKGVVDVSTNREWREFMLQNFPEIRRAIGDDVAYREFDIGMFNKMAQKGMKPLQYIDGIVRTMAACGAYQKLAQEMGIEVDLKNPNQGLIQQATRLMRYSQGSSFFKDQPLAITTGMGLWGGLSGNRASLQFQSFMLNRWSNLVRQVWRMGIRERDYKKAAFAFFWMVIVASALETGIRKGTRSIINLLTGSEDKKKGSFVGDMALNMVQNVPLAGQIVSSLTYGSTPVPVIAVLEETEKGLSQAVKGKKIKTKAKGVVQAAGGVGAAAGIPGSSQAAQIIKKVID